MVTRGVQVTKFETLTARPCRKMFHAGKLKCGKATRTPDLSTRRDKRLRRWEQLGRSAVTLSANYRRVPYSRASQNKTL